MDLMLANCTMVFSQHHGLFAVFFLGGLTSGFVHCLAMCGPVVAGQSACASGCSKRMLNGLQWSYHLGRMTTYGALGFLAALFSKQIAAWEFWPVLSSMMLVAAGAMFIVSSLPQRKYSACHVSARTNYVRGALMGFMPCGMIYAALMMASTLANPLLGMFAMWLFVIGTVPALLLASGSAELFGMKWKNGLQKFGRMVMAFNGFSLLVMATKIMG